MKIPRKQPSRDWRPVSLGIGFTVFALTAVVALHFELRHYVELYLNGLDARKIKVPAVEDFGSAGEYFNLVIGVPLALLGALIAAAASVILAQFTLSKDDITIFSFVENLMRPVSARIRGLVEAFVKLVVIGNDCRELTAKVHDAITTSEMGDYTPGATIADLLSPEQRDQFLPEARAQIENIKTNLEEWTRQYEQLIATMYGALFAHEKIATALATPPWGTANSYLRKTLPPSLLKQVGLVDDLEQQWAVAARGSERRREKADARDPAEHSNDVRQILSFLTNHDVKTEDALESFSRAASLLPEKSTTIEFVGAAIYSPLCLLEAPQRRLLKGFTIHGYLINMGAAQLLTLYQYIPDRVAIKSALNKIFEHRSKAAEKFLSLAAPTPRDFTHFSVDDSIRRQFAQPERMIVVLIEGENEKFSSQTYDRNRHGEIPRTGYRP